MPLRRNSTGKPGGVPEATCGVTGGLRIWGFRVWELKCLKFRPCDGSTFTRPCPRQPSPGQRQRKSVMSGSLGQQSRLHRSPSMHSLGKFSAIFASAPVLASKKTLRCLAPLASSRVADAWKAVIERRPRGLPRSSQVRLRLNPLFYTKSARGSGPSSADELAELEARNFSKVAAKVVSTHPLSHNAFGAWKYVAIR